MSGNGVDVAAVYQLLNTVASDVRTLTSDVRTLASDMRELRYEVTRKADKEDVARLRQAVVEYHSAVIGHGVLITELDDRLRRIEHHLGFSAA